MSEMGEAFLSRLGAAAPAAPPGLRFPKPVHQFLWEGIYEEVGAGWYMNRFLYLFGEGLEALERCLDAWSFLVPPRSDRMILGRNAYGAVLVLEHASGGAASARVHVLDPLTVEYWTDPSIDFGGLLGYWLPQRQIPRFMGNDIYEAWLRAGGRYLEPHEMLGIKVPLGLGGALELDNFQVEDIGEYYRTTGPIYAKAFALASSEVHRGE